jgi:hypothetical protein
MPFRQGLAFVQEAIGTGFGHPSKVFWVAYRKHGAVGDELVAVGISQTTATVYIEHSAGHAGIVNFAGLLVLQFMDATLGTAIA